MVLFLLLGIQKDSASSIIADAVRKLGQAKTITVTLVVDTEEFPKPKRTLYWFQKGGYFRSEMGHLVDVGNPKQGWTYDSGKKIYQSRDPLPKDFSMLPAIGIQMLSAGLPIIGEATKVVWHKRPAIRVRLDPRRKMTKEAKLYLFFDPKTHLPIGISANLGSVTQLRIYENMKIDSKIDAKRFTFAPPKGWKQVTAETGGWQ